MRKRIVLIAAVTAATAGSLFADFTYEQTSKITGGAMMNMMRVAGVFSKSAREPMRSTILVKGNRMATVTANATNVIDLDKETITEINLEKKTYSVVTFAQMAEALKQLEAKMKSDKGDQQMDLTIKSSAKSTGQKRDINGLPTEQMLVTMEFEGTDRKTKERGTFMVMVNDMWVATGIAGYQEVQQFYQRMAQKLAWAPGGNMFMQSPETQKGMAELTKEMAKVNGVPVYQLTKMNMGAAVPEAGGAPPPQQQQQEAQPAKPSGGALGRIGGRLGGFGGLGRRREEPQQNQQQAQGQSGAPTSFMEMTTELSGFSAAPVDASKFDVPAGFKQVESETLKGMRR